jgi:hypothetical protein
VQLYRPESFKKTIFNVSDVTERAKKQFGVNLYIGNVQKNNFGDFGSFGMVERNDLMEL